MHPVVYVAFGILLVELVLLAVFWGDISERGREECVDEDGTCGD